MQLKILVGCLLPFVLCSCAATSVKHTWKAPDYRGGPLRHIAVLAIDERVLVRKGFENRLAEQFRKQGVSVTKTHELLSLSDISQDKKAAAERFHSAGAQAVAILRLADLSTGYRQVRPGRERYTGYINDIGMDSWYTYFSMAFTDLSPTYGSLKQTAYVEAGLYDLATTKRLWAGLTRTVAPETMDRIAEMDQIVKKVVGAMRKDGMVP